MTSALLSPSLPLDLPLQTSGRVADILSDGSIIVECAGRGWRCRKAASCLLVPENGDVVLLARSGNEKLWLLAVLERASPAHASELSVDGDLAISARGGSLSLSGDQNLALDGRTLRVKANDGECSIGNLDYQGGEISARVRVSRWIGNRCESVWHTLTQISQLAFRQVKQTEHVRAGQLDYQAQDYMRLHARSTLISSDTITKIDSDQIHMG